MPIPKVSRTLILNLIYLLTITVLGFNISPGYVNVFRQLDNSLIYSNKSIDRFNDSTVTHIEEYNSKYYKREPVLEAAQKVRKITKDFSIYIDGLKALIAAGDLPLCDLNIYYPAEDNKHANQPYNYNDKDVTMRILLNEERKGRALGKKIEETRMAMMEVVKELLREGKWGMKEDEFGRVYGVQMSLFTGDEWKSKGTPSWEHYVFDKMPVATSLAMLSKIKADAQNSAGTLIGYLTTLLSSGGCFDDIVPYQILSRPKSSYVFEGDEYETVLIGASLRRSFLLESIGVNGYPLPTEYGIATYSTRARGVGTKKYTVNISASAYPKWKKIQSSSTFEYEVIRPSIALAAEKLNVLYVGVDNPISITAPDISADQLKVAVSGPAGLTGSGKNYVIKPTAIGEAIIKVTGPGFSLDFKFRVKPIPDPLATLGGKDASGEMDEETFKAQKAVFTVLSNFDFDAYCSIESFEMHRQPKRADAISVKNEGGAFNEATKALQSMATSGDLYYFDEVLARCPGDSVARKINAMTWRIR